MTEDARLIDNAGLTNGRRGSRHSRAPKFSGIAYVGAALALVAAGGWLVSQLQYARLVLSGEIVIGTVLSRLRAWTGALTESRVREAESAIATGAWIAG
jgi:hypothetical protein